MVAVQTLHRRSRILTGSFLLVAHRLPASNAWEWWFGDGQLPDELLYFLPFQERIAWWHRMQEASMIRFFSAILLIAAGLASWSAVHAGLNDRLPPAAYIDPIDQQIAKTGKGVAGRPFPCSREKMEQGIVVVEGQSTDRCVKMLSMQHWRGLWRNDFEGSQFCPASAKTCPPDAQGDRIWLTPGSLHGARGAVYAVEFLGRRTKYRGQYGHLGMSDHEIIVDKPISAKMIKAPPRPMTKAELIANMKECEAAGTCIPSDEMKALMSGRK